MRAALLDYMPAERPRTLVMTLARQPGKPWWWRHLDHGSAACLIDHDVVVVKARPSGPFSIAFASMCARIVSILFRARGKYRYVVTFECDWTSFIVAGVQTMLGFRRPRHVIAQFIMREKTASFASKVKYAFMKWCFSSVYLCVCSSRSEGEYYMKAFGWPRHKVGYAPLHTDPGFLEREPVDEEHMTVSAGRTFRDYKTLLDAFAGSDLPLTIVASPANIGAAAIPANVTVLYDLPITELIDLIARSKVVILPLENREISIGQSVLLEAMTMGKAVVVTRVNGTVDYVEHMKTGILVPPHDAGAIRDAVSLLMNDVELRRRLGDAARAHVLEHHLPRHYAADVAAILAGGGEVA
jgi:glycosyltransferase involved in cell wall biosynthesis